MFEQVETIGSVYMVVSGLPSRNKNRHVSEVARLSLELLAGTENFVRPFRGKSTLQLRIGFHTGECVFAGFSSACQVEVSSE